MKFIIIDNKLENIVQYDNLGIYEIMIDLERYRKNDRQKNLDTFKSNHTINDINIVNDNVSKSKVLVRLDQINPNTENQINECIDRGVQKLMLPYFKKVNQVENFLNIVNNRVKTSLLFETISSIKNIEEIMNLGMIDEVHFGLNDLSIDMKERFMLNTLTSDYVKNAISFLKYKKVPYGIGGIAPLNMGLIKGKYVIDYYLHLGASKTILSRDFKKLLNPTSSKFKYEYMDLVEHIRKFNSSKYDPKTF